MAKLTTRGTPVVVAVRRSAGVKLHLSYQLNGVLATCPCDSRFLPSRLSVVSDNLALVNCRSCRKRVWAL